MPSTPTYAPALHLDSVTVARGGRTLIAGLTLHLNAAKLLWVEGGNGIGKTSLLRTCAGLSRPASGAVSWHSSGTPAIAPQTVAFLPAHNTAKPGLTLGEAADFWGADPAQVGLSAHTTTRTEKLSTGQLRRLGLAKLLAANKPIWILDEPLAGLDADGRDWVAGLIAEHVGRGGLAVIASHAPIPVENVPTRRLALSAP